jgi:chromosome segregation ATPase
MKPNLLAGRRTQLIVLAVAGLRLGSIGAVAGEKSSLTDTDIESTEAKVALESSQRENAALRQRVTLVQQQVAALTESLAIANSESEVFKRETTDLKLRLEALGLDAASPDKSLLEQRLLKAVSDLKIVQDQKAKLTEQLIRINEAIIRFIKTASSIDGDARMALEAEMRSSTALLGNPGTANQTATNADAAGSLMDARVISVKEELALIVANLGRVQGAKIGMPFQVWREGRKIGIARIVDVRENISGAIFQSLDPSEKAKVGDSLRVDAQM